MDNQHMDGLEPPAGTAEPLLGALAFVEAMEAGNEGTADDAIVGLGEQHVLEGLTVVAVAALQALAKERGVPFAEAVQQIRAVILSSVAEGAIPMGRELKDRWL